MANSITRFLVALDMPKGNKQYIARVKGMLVALTNNAYITSPTPTVAVFGADIANLDAAEVATVKRAPGAVAHRDAMRVKVQQDVQHLADCVQGVAETSAADPIVVIESAGFRVRTFVARNKPTLAAKDGAVSGDVALVAKAAGKAATYYWQWSPDGKSWTSLADTMKASTSALGLTPGQTYSFRFRTLTRKGASDWSQIVTRLVK
jgi:hypothetical protein